MKIARIQVVTWKKNEVDDVLMGFSLILSFIVNKNSVGGEKRKIILCLGTNFKLDDALCQS